MNEASHKPRVGVLNSHRFLHSIDASVKKTPWKSLTPVKRPSPRSTSPVAKRLDSGPSVAQATFIEQQHDDVEYGFGSEQEQPYIPDDITPIDFDDFDCAVNMDAYETRDAPLDEIDAFPLKRHHFQTAADIIDDELDNDERQPDLSPPSFDVSTGIDSDRPTLTVKDAIEYCPPREQELPYTPDPEPVDLTLFGSAVHLSAYDLSRYFDDEVEFLGELLTDDEPLDLIDDYGLIFDDMAVLFRTQEEHAQEEDIDYNDIPFSNYVFEGIALVE